MNLKRSKFNREEWIELKEGVRQAHLTRLSREETVAVLRAKLKRTDIYLWDIDKILSRLKGETEAFMKSMVLDRMAYAAAYKKRIDEYELYKKCYWQIFYANAKNPYLQKVTLDSLQNVSAALTQLYDILPVIASGNIADAIFKTRALPPSPETRARVVPRAIREQVAAGEQ